MSLVEPSVEIDALRGELLASQRQAHVGAMAAVLAHELNNLATPVLVRAQDAIARDDVAAMRKALNVTLTNVQRAVDMTQALLDLTRTSTLNTEPVELSGLVADAVEATVRPYAKDGIELRCLVATGIAVRGNRLLLTQMLIHMLSELRQSILDRAGRITIAASADDQGVSLELSSKGRLYSQQHVEEQLAPWMDPVRQPPALIRDSAELPFRAVRLIADAHGARLSVAPTNPHGAVIRTDFPLHSA
ncbi:MAG: HAMP domain-containing histidine kinase [Planctomycetes bacterium]|nr:HAMP domain-containing histidine kinase [Planctomycetota bacterium]